MARILNCVAPSARLLFGRHNLSWHLLKRTAGGVTCIEGEPGGECGGSEEEDEVVLVEVVSSGEEDGMVLGKLVMG